MEDISKITLVTWGQFSVSTTAGSGIEGCILRIDRRIDVSEECARRHGYHGQAADGKHWTCVRIVREQFPSQAAARRWAFEHGYLQCYFADPQLRAGRVRRAS